MNAFKKSRSAVCGGQKAAKAEKARVARLRRRAAKSALRLGQECPNFRLNERNVS